MANMIPTIDSFEYEITPIIPSKGVLEKALTNRRKNAWEVAVRLCHMFNTPYQIKDKYGATVGIVDL